MRRLLGILGILTIVLSLWYIIHPAGHIPPYDANLVRLAESPLQGWCAGITLVRSRGVGDADTAATCREEYQYHWSDDPDMDRVESAFCEGIASAGYPLSTNECLSILRAYELWPTYDGSVTNQWNRARPYPHEGSITAPQPIESDSRTGDRQGNVRVPPSRDYTPAPTPSAGSTGATGPTGTTGG